MGAWRNVDPSYSAKQFPSGDSVVYLSMTHAELSYYGFPNTTQHLSTCHTCDVTDSNLSNDSDNGSYVLVFHVSLLETVFRVYVSQI